MIPLEEFKVQVESLSAPVARELGVDLVDVGVVIRHGTYSIEILADLPGGGIGLELCASFNRALTRVFDEQPWANDYELSVCSPGLDRPLKAARDFRRLINQDVHMLLTEKIDGRGEYAGTVKEVDEDAVVISVKDKDVVIPYEKILKSVLQI